MAARSSGPGVSTVTRVPRARRTSASRSSVRVISRRSRRSSRSAGPDRAVRDDAGHRREHVDLVQAGLGQRPQRRGRAHAAVHVAAAVDDDRLVPAGDGAGRDHGVGERHPRGTLAAEHHAAPRVVVHGDDPGPAVGPGPRRPARSVLPGLRLQRRHGVVQGFMPSPAAGQPGAGPDPGMHPVRGEQGGEHQPGRAGPQVRAGRQRPVVQVAHARVAERGRGLAALQGGYLVQGDAAAQGGREDAARAGADDQVDVAERHGQPLLHDVQGPGHPGRPHHPAGAEHQAGPSPACRLRAPGSVCRQAPPSTRSGPMVTSWAPAPGTTSPEGRTCYCWVNLRYTPRTSGYPCGGQPRGWPSSSASPRRMPLARTRTSGTAS